ncbi:hypothetical protein SDRG_05327 [Saprolegnia diclina VS20]|uniref:YHYH domain-containing protein n=1 Tax=Saprolegnia diclina (strain VS20) TaxID=1156394 RepID=T0QSW7_SAPDV|nr:hypothetical protein SDRG_05327 [Saprolegnia diclina VS20]EQC37100.1 hypothetical protein SDRG_05327 [Saprolegnia diclina VS20]|eukprot:XP_008609262.1 hypothetical protein SDRG_05327 [Saprolegnia diclina VS20]
MRILAWLLLPLAARGDAAVPRAAYVNSIGNVGAVQNIRLEADLAIPAGRELQLPITVPPIIMAVNSNAPAKVVSVTTSHADGAVGVGEVIDISVQFNSAIDVVGSPGLILRTGCHSPACRVPEIQTFFCRATSGAFAIAFNGQAVTNVPYNATPSVLREYLRRLTCIAEVTVVFDAGVSACSFRGTNVVVTFDRVNFAGVDGDLPLLTTDARNTGGSNKTLVHHTFPVLLSPVATEVQAGVCVVDRTATFLGAGATVVRFRYVVQPGDATDDLEYAGTDALLLHSGDSMCNHGTTIGANTKLPVPGRPPAWATGGTSSLGVNAAIVVNTSTPVVLSVSSSTPNGIYGVGQLIEIGIVMSVPIAYTGAPFLVLATGVNTAPCPIVRVDGGTVLVAQYVVGPGHTSLDLTYVSPTSLVLHAGDSIRRLSTSPTTDANVTLPINGRPGSLFVTKNLVIDTTSPYVTSVFALSPAGAYTAGDVVQLAVTFSRPVSVVGTPVFQLNTGFTDLFPGFVVETVPTNGDAHVFTLPSELDLSSLSTGCRVSIGGQLFTVLSVLAPYVTMAEAYTGPPVATRTNGASPLLRILAPGYQLATYVGGSTSQTLQFQYVVQIGDASADLATVSDLVFPLGASIRRLSTTPTTNVTPDLPALGSINSLDANAALIVDATAPVVVAVTTTNRDGVYGPGQTIALLITFSYPVAVVGLGTPRVLVNTGIDRFATYVSGSGTPTLTFALTTMPTDAAPAFGVLGADAIRMPNALVSVCRLSANPRLRAVLTLPSLLVGQIRVDPLAPSITSVVLASATATLFRVGDNLDVLVAFTEAVDVAGAPVVALNVGTAVFVSGSGSTTLLFRYIVGLGDATTRVDVATIYVVTLTAGTTIQSTATARAACLVVQPTLALDRHLPVLSEQVDVLAVRGVSIDGLYPLGAVVTAVVEFTDPVVVPGAPRLWLATGNPNGDQPALFASVDANNVYFTYTVQAGDAASRITLSDSNALRCWNDFGLNLNPATDAVNVVATAFGDAIVVGWTEGPVLRVKLSSSNPALPLWTRLETGAGLNVDATKAADGLACATLGAQLVCAWHETNGNAFQLYAAAFNGVVTAPSWTLLTLTGLNVNAAFDAKGAATVAFNGKLYVAWAELQASGLWTLRLSVWNGNVLTPSWTRIDGTLPLAAASGHTFPTWQVYGGQPVLAWQQSTPTTSTVRVATYNGIDGAPVWTTMDSGGLNAASTGLAARPSLAVCAGSLYTIWQETPTPGPSVAQIHVKVFGQGTAWSAVSPSGGLTSATTTAGTLPKLACSNVGKLFASWQEATTPSTLRISLFNMNVALPQWTLVTAAANDNSAGNAVGASLVSTSAYVYLVWSEALPSASFQARAAVWDALHMSWNSVTYACIQRVGSAFNIPVALHLPEMHSGASLSDLSHLAIDTSVPTIMDIRSVNAPAGLYGVSDTIQTVDVLAVSSSPIVGGQFQLQYNGYPTACLAWNAAASDVQAALNGIASIALAVAVSKVSGAYLAGDLFAVTFTSPALGVQPLTIGTGCAPLTCASGLSGLACGAVVVNAARSATPLQPGFLDFQVVFSAPVQSLGAPPTLTIATGAGTTATAVYTPASATQYIDVGVTGTSVVAGGSYQLQYGTATTGCIDPFVADGAPTSLRAQLLLLPAIATLGVASVETDRVQNGWRHTIIFATGSPLALTPANGVCDGLSGAVQTIDVAASGALTSGGFTVGHASVGSVSACLDHDVSAATLQATLTTLLGGIFGVQVTRQNLALRHRYTITFSDGTLAQRSIDVATTGCAAFACTGGPCASSSVVANADYVVAVAATPIATFRYVVQPGDNIARVTPQTLSGGLSRAGSSPAVSASTVLPPTLSLPPLQLHAVALPAVVSVTPMSANGAYSTGDRIWINVVFSHAMLVLGRPAVELNSNGVALYRSGNLTTTLLFQYTVLPGETTAQLDVFSAYSLRGYVLYYDATTSALAPATLTLPMGASASSSLAGQSSISIDASIPSVVSVTSTKPAGAYGAGEVIDFTVQLSLPVAVTGAPSIALTSGGEAVFSLAGARQLIDIGTTAVITSGQYAVTYGSSQTSCINYNDVAMLQTQLLALPAIAAIGLTSVVAAPFGVGTRITVIFASSVPYAAPLALIPVQVPQCAPLTAGVNDKALVRRGLDASLVFRFTVGVSDAINLLDKAGAAISLNGGSIQRQSLQPSINALLTLPTVQVAGIRIAGAPPTIAQVTMRTVGGVYGVAFPPVPSPATAKPGQVVFELQFSLPVVFESTVTIALNSGGTALVNAQLSPTTFSFVYTVQLGDATPSLEFASSALTGRIVTLSTSRSQVVTPSLPLLGLSGANVIQIQSTLPAAVTSITSNHSSGSIGAGEVVDVQVGFGKPICTFSGVNIHPRLPADGPDMVVLDALTYLAWSERSSPTQSMVYVSTFDGTQYRDITLPASGVNRDPRGDAAHPKLGVWNSVVYVAWAEDGIINVAYFNGQLGTPAWTLLPFMGTNANQMAVATTPTLIEYLGVLFVAWIERPVATPAVSVVRVASGTASGDWTFYDTKVGGYGLNTDPATELTLYEFHSQLYLAWVETQATTKASSIHVAMLALSTMTWVPIPQVGVKRNATASGLTFSELSTTNGSVFKLHWSTTGVSNAQLPQLHVATVYPQYWKEEDRLQGSPGVDISLALCQGNTFAAWRRPIAGVATQVVAGAVHASGFLMMRTSSLNHNTSNDVLGLKLACLPTGLGLFWTEYDGVAAKARLQTAPATLPLQWTEVPLNFPSLALTSGLVALGTDRSGSCASVLNFRLTVPASAPLIPLLNVVSLNTNRAAILEATAFGSANLVLFPAATDTRSLSYSTQLTIDTTPPTVLDVSTNATAGSYGVGHVLYVSVQFSAPVSISPCATGSAAVLLFESSEPSIDGTTVHFARYVGGNTTDTLIFAYTTGAFDAFSHFDYPLVSSLQLNATCRGAIWRAASTPTTAASLTLPLPGGGHSIRRVPITIRNTAPIVTNIVAANASGTYYSGDVLVVRVSFSLPVVVTGAPSLWLVVQPNGVVGDAVYVGGSGTTTLLFRYVVSTEDAGAVSLWDDRIARTGVDFTWALRLNDGSIKRLATIPTTPAIVACPAPGTPGSLDLNSQLVLVSSPPRVLAVTTSKPDGTYDVGENIDLSVRFSLPVAVTGYPQLVLNTNSYGTATALYTGGSGSATLTFRYTVQWGDSANPLAYVGPDALVLVPPPALDLLQPPPLATIRLVSTHPVQPANLTLPPLGPLPQVNAPTNLEQNGHFIGIRTDGYRPLRVVTTASNGTYCVGQVLPLVVRFPAPVVVTGVPSLALNVPSTATYVSGSNSDSLQFTYIVAPGDVAVALDVTAIVLAANQRITDPTGLPVSLTLPAGGSGSSLRDTAALGIAGVPPTVVRLVGVSPSGTYAAGDSLTFAVVFSAPVVISGAAPVVTLNTGHVASYRSGSGSTSLVFQYTVQAGDNGVLDVAGTGAFAGIVLGQSTTPTTPANVAVPAPGAASSLAGTSALIVMSVPPVVVAVTYVDVPYQSRVVCTSGDTLQIQVAFSATVVVAPGAVPTLTLATRGATNAIATYLGGSGSRYLFFRYIVQPTDAASVLEYAASNRLIGSIYLASAVPTVLANLALPPIGRGRSLSDHAVVTVCNTCPYVVSVSSPSATIASAGQVLTFSITFSIPVFVLSGQLQLRLAMPLERYATYTSGNGSTSLELSYTVQTGDDAYPVEVVNKYSLFGATVVSAAPPSLVASLQLPLPGTASSLSVLTPIRIDTSPPTITKVSTTTPDGTYGPGQVISIAITYSFPVVVMGTPTLTLALTTPGARLALYSPSASTSTTLQFVYTVAVGDAVYRLDYMRLCSQSLLVQELEGYDTAATGLGCLPSGSALELNGGAIKAQATTPVVDASTVLPAVNPWPLVRYVGVGNNVTYASPGVGPIASAPPQSLCTYTDEGSEFLLLSNGVPNHAVPPTVQPTNYLFELPRFPSVGFARRRPVGIVGILVNGVPINNTALGDTVVADACGGAVDAMGRYSYVAAPTCLGLTNGLLGFALDGFPIYAMPVRFASYLDECSGYVDRDGLYRYYLNTTLLVLSRTFLPCYKGTPVSANAADTYKLAAIAGVEGFAASSINLKQLQVIPADVSGLWRNPSNVAVSTTASFLYVSSTGIPDGVFGPFPNAYNPHTIKQKAYTFVLPRSPTWSNVPSPVLPDRPIGVMLNGIPFYSYMDSSGNSLRNPASANYLILDACNGYVDGAGAYRYYAAPDCLLDALNDVAGTTSPVIGYALDGYPVYGRYDSTGAVPLDLDACNGKWHADGRYGYHVTDTPPYTINCFHGVVPTTTGAPLYRSLSTSSAITISSAAPRIRDATSERRPGTYGEGDAVDIQLLWSAPVVVTGAPTLTLAIFNNITSAPASAQYVAARSSATTSVFVYTVGPHEFASSIRLASINALVLPPGAGIYRQATVPTLPAELTCPATALVLADRVQTVATVELKVRGLYHSAANAISAVVVHNDIFASVFQPVAAPSSVFGRPVPPMPSVVEKTTGLGVDVAFVDMVFGPNLALGGTATQSSTFGPSGRARHAIDGNRSPFHASLGASRTSGDDPMPWWQLRLAQPASIGTIKLFQVAQATSQLEVQLVQTSGPVLAAGTFQLLFQSCTTNPIAVDAVPSRADESVSAMGASLQALLEPCTGAIAVSRSALQRLNMYTWSVTFLETRGDVPLLQAIGITSPTLSVAISTLFPGSDNTFYAYQEPLTPVFDLLVPCYVMVFDALASMTFESYLDALENAVWSQQVTSGDDEISLVLPPGVRGQYIRVQRTDDLVLSLAEVEVYAEYQRSFSRYNQGSPIRGASYASSSVQAWAPEVSFAYAFGGISSVGAWTLRLTDHAPTSTVDVGGVSDWQLIITNSAGTSVTYYMDVTARLLTLPKYGQVLLDISQTEVDYLDTDGNNYLDTTEATTYLVNYWPQYALLDAFQRYRVLAELLETYASTGCVPVWGELGQQRTRPRVCATCVVPSTYLELYTAASRATANTFVLKGRHIQYAPQSAAFVGLDALYFSISLENQESADPGLVRIETLPCREATCAMDVHDATSPYQALSSTLVNY